MTALGVRIRRVRPERDADLPLPAPSTPGSSGVDLAAAVEQEVVLTPGERLAVPTGFAIELPPGFEGQVRARSGLALHHGIVLPNAPGTIDSDYRGEIRVILLNLGPGPFTIRRGARIAQLVVCPVVQPQWEVVAAGDDLGDTERGGGGFGHTGS